MLGVRARPVAAAVVDVQTFGDRAERQLVGGAVGVGGVPVDPNAPVTGLLVDGSLPLPAAVGLLDEAGPEAVGEWDTLSHVKLKSNSAMTRGGASRRRVGDCG